ncbi:MAG: hypothetical protein L0Y57_10340 [Beijerinckiaceae bacterium]|nr:hypothetical protein [Beijerinckiaceae bacterium]
MLNPCLRSRRYAGFKRLWIAFLAAAALGSAAISGQADRHQNPDWPCRQILVGRISLASVWFGPPIEGVAWQNDPAAAQIAARLAPRRTPLAEAESEIGAFAQAQGAQKTQSLVAVFAALFEMLNAERAQVIEGLLRLGAKQKELAAKLRAENAPPGESSVRPPPTHQGKEGDGRAAREMELRLFEERRQTLAFVCETPALIEQRLFALARAIQRDLE